MRCKLVADVAVLERNKVLLLRYEDTSKYDHQSGWFLPDDFLTELEHPEDAARRIAREQIGVDLPDVRLGEIESFGNGAWHLVFHYVARLDSARESTAVSPGPNVAETKWFPLDALPDPSTVAHEGWALDVLRRVAS